MCQVLCETSNGGLQGQSINPIATYRGMATCKQHMGDVWYVDALNPDMIPDGNANHPFYTLLDGYNAAAHGGIVQVKGYGTTTPYLHGPRIDNRPMTIRADASGGLVRIR
jgi:hypothetical protein